jgi:hypothetical protein
VCACVCACVCVMGVHERAAYIMALSVSVAQRRENKACVMSEEPSGILGIHYRLHGAMHTSMNEPGDAHDRVLCTSTRKSLHPNPLSSKFQQQKNHPPHTHASSHHHMHTHTHITNTCTHPHEYMNVLPHRTASLATTHTCTASPGLCQRTQAQPCQLTCQSCPPHADVWA